MVTGSFGASTPSAANFGDPVAVTIRGSHGDAMEPFVSTDGNYLFFNSRNEVGTDTKRYFARRLDDTTFLVRRCDRRREPSST